ncbi:MAG: phosphoenolpyruvate--protein phosphotransferase [Desulfobacterales bacterium]|nr:phosphoenolpyruvate--protein phosphotransferase [Desulfobacterales bacterium]
MPKTASKEITLQGIGASPGICIGKAYLVDREGIYFVDKYHIPDLQIPEEIKRFKVAVKKATDELRAVIEKTPDELRQHTYILEAHIVLLKDKMFYGKTLETIQNEHVNAEWALKKVLSNIKSMFRNMSDSYLKERSADIVHVSDLIMNNLVGIQQVNIGNIDKRVILVTHDLSPAQTSQIQLEKIKGFITVRGGKASHTGIIARTLEIPAVLGVDAATRIIKNDDYLILDGYTGSVILHPSDRTLADYEERIMRFAEHKAEIRRESQILAKTADGLQIQVMGNIELPEEVASVVDYGGDGIGLYRTEFQYLSRPDFPTEFELFEKYKYVIEIMAPKPVTIRTLDINGDKATAASGDADEINPALGLRAIRYCLKKPEIFKTQLRAILRAAVFGNVRLLLPMISCIDEILEAKRLLDEAADDLKKAGLSYNRDIKIGIMIEVPSAVIMADVLAEYVDFFSIGTNDLIQYSLAIDRENIQVAYLYNVFNPAIIRMIRHTVTVAKDKGIPVFMCGEMAGDPINIPILLGLGLDELSMNPQSIPAVKNIIRSLTVEDTRLFLRDVLKQKSAADITDLVQKKYGIVSPEKIFAG